MGTGERGQTRLCSLQGCSLLFQGRKGVKTPSLQVCPKKINCPCFTQILNIDLHLGSSKNAGGRALRDQKARYFLHTHTYPHTHPHTHMHTQSYTHAPSHTHSSTNTDIPGKVPTLEHWETIKGFSRTCVSPGATKDSPAHSEGRLSHGLSCFSSTHNKDGSRWLLVNGLGTPAY